MLSDGSGYWRTVWALYPGAVPAAQVSVTAGVGNLAGAGFGRFGFELDPAGIKDHLSGQSGKPWKKSKQPGPGGRNRGGFHAHSLVLVDRMGRSFCLSNKDGRSAGEASELAMSSGNCLMPDRAFSDADYGCRPPVMVKNNQPGLLEKRSGC